MPDTKPIRLFVPPSATTGTRPRSGAKNRDGLYIGAVVVVENTGYGAATNDGGEMPLTCLVSHVYADDEPATDADGTAQAWLGNRPFIDAVGVHEKTSQQCELVQLRKLPYFRDVVRGARMMGVPGEAVTWPGYRIVTSLEGIT